MALKKAIAPLIVNGSIDTKSDEFLVSKDLALEQINTNFDEIGAIKKICGSTIYSDDIDTGGTLSALLPIKLISHQKQLLALVTSGEVYAYRADLLKWQKVSGYEKIFCNAFIESKYSDQLDIICSSVSELSTKEFRAVAYITSDERVGYETTKLTLLVEDYVTNTKKILYELEAGAGAGTPCYLCKVDIYNTTNPVIFLTLSMWNYSLGSGKVFTKAFYKDGTILSSDIDIVTGASTGTIHFTTLLIGNKLLVVSAVYSGALPLYSTRIKYIVTDGLTISSGTSITHNSTYPVILGQTNFDLILIGNNVYYSRVINKTSVKTGAIVGLNKDTLASTFAEYALGIGITKQCGKCILSAIDNDNILTVYSINEGSDPLPSSSQFINDFTIAEIITISTATSSGISFSYNATIASKMFSLDNTTDRYYIAQIITPLSSKYVLTKISLDATYIYYFVTIETFANYSAMGDILTSSLTRNYMLSNISIGKDGNYYFPALTTSRQLSYDYFLTLGYIYIRNISLYRFELANVSKGLSCYLGDSTFICASNTKEYDSYLIRTQAFLDVPTIYCEERGSGTTLPAGTYSYIAILEWVDINGNINRSSYSYPFTITKATTQDITVKCNNDLLVNNALDSKYNYKNYSIILYRTTTGGTIYYRLGNGIRGNYTTGLIFPYYDSTLDSALIAGEQLYITGGVLDNQLLPPVKYLLTANNRIFAISSEDENLLYFSQQRIAGETVNFNSLLSLRVDMGQLRDEGKSEALGVMDSKIIVFKDNGIVYFYGDGPTQTGESNNFSSPQLISNEVGISEVRSIINIPNGILFKSKKGIYLLDRSFNLSYIGAAVESYNSETIKGTSVKLDDHKAFFITASRTLVFDYLQEKWSTISFISGVDMINHNGLPTYIKSNRIYKLDESVYKDNASYYSMKLKTSWLKLKGIQEYQRIYALILVGKFYSAHTLTVKIYFDYNESDYEEHTLSPLITDDIYQYQISMSRQKCQAFKIEIFDNVSAGSGQGFKLTNISVSLGQKRGLRKIADSKKYVS